MLGVMRRKANLGGAAGSAAINHVRRTITVKRTSINLPSDVQEWLQAQEEIPGGVSGAISYIVRALRRYGIEAIDLPRLARPTTPPGGERAS
jgi:hypothetical protein